MRFEAVGRSDVGLVRANNEDSWTASASLLAVSDGVGGRPAGEVASRLTVSVFRALVGAGASPDAAARAADETVRDVGAGNSLFTGMCATLTAAVATADGIRLAHVGDSTAWLVRDGHVQQVTTPQTVVQALLARGEITAEAALTDPRRNTMSQAVGGIRVVVPVVLDVGVRRGDRLVLATDGLDYAEESTRLALLAAPKPADELADALVAAAIEGGGRDNVTVVVADVVDD